ncbi:hypothetical protein [Rhodococcoides kroppenstedtii]|uniref:hypothetical protein n=1 Tax=Rhodococcoides kroppenstedtii TaxID=293050 RepID=UPI001427C024|nr:hypothetical protein [Rhodococcus kroppenstedtii]NIL82090.1 hypothetical protein [Rhodococcus kroppenstedtii]
MTVRSRTLGRAGIVVAAAAAGVLATSGTASAAVLTVVALPTPGEESISTLVTATPTLVFEGDVECTVTATEVGNAENTASETGTLAPPLGIPVPTVAFTGTIDIDGLEAGTYTVSAMCNDGRGDVTSILSAPVLVLPEGTLPPLPPVPGGGSLPTDLFES